MRTHAGVFVFGEDCGFVYLHNLMSSDFPNFQSTAYWNENVTVAGWEVQRAALLAQGLYVASFVYPIHVLITQKKAKYMIQAFGVSSFINIFLWKSGYDMGLIDNEARKNSKMEDNVDVFAYASVNMAAWLISPTWAVIVGGLTAGCQASKAWKVFADRYMV